MIVSIDNQEGSSNADDTREEINPAAGHISQADVVTEYPTVCRCSSNVLNFLFVFNVLVAFDNQPVQTNNDDIRDDIREDVEPAPAVVACRKRVQKNRRRRKGLLGYHRKASQSSVVSQIKRVGVSVVLLNRYALNILFIIRRRSSTVA